MIKKIKEWGAIHRDLQPWKMVLSFLLKKIQKYKSHVKKSVASNYRGRVYLPIAS